MKIYYSGYSLSADFYLSSRILFSDAK